MYSISSLSRGSHPRTTPGEFSPPHTVRSWQPCAHHVHPSLWTVAFLRQLEWGRRSMGKLQPTSPSPPACMCPVGRPSWSTSPVLQMGKTSKAQSFKS